MEIKFKAPTSFIFDVSDKMLMMDPEQIIHPLAWLYVVERALAVRFAWNICSSTPRCRHLTSQYALVEFIQTNHSIYLTEIIPEEIGIALRRHVVRIHLDREAFVVTAVRPLPGELLYDHPVLTV